MKKQDNHPPSPGGRKLSSSNPPFPVMTLLWLGGDVCFSDFMPLKITRCFIVICIRPGLCSRWSLWRVWLVRKVELVKNQSQIFFLATAKVSCHQPCQQSQQKESYLFIYDLHESQSKHSMNPPLASHTLPSLWRECFPPSTTSEQQTLGFWLSNLGAAQVVMLLMTLSHHIGHSIWSVCVCKA